MKSSKLQSPRGQGAHLRSSQAKTHLAKKVKKVEVEQESLLEEEKGESKDEVLDVFNDQEDKRIITDKEFYKQMQKLKDRGTNAVPPKKSASAYIIFGKEKRGEILRRNPQAKVTEVVKEIAQCWGRLSKEERQKYKDQARKDKERYEKELRSLESFSEKLKKPKKCLSAYMIFVKETRPTIVDDNPEMGALQIMQEVGKQWQSLTNDQRKYFKDKADRDKIRYLDEQRSFYDEVEKIGRKVGTVMSNEGQVSIASVSQADPSFRGNQISGKPKVKEQQVTPQSTILQKRKHIPPKHLQSTSEPEPKRLRTRDEHTSNQVTSSANNSQQVAEGKPKKPLSAYIYFSQEFREIIRQKYPQLTVNQIMKAVSYRWQSLTKEEKQPFEHIAIEDKQRYDRETQEFKKGAFLGRQATPIIKLQNLTDTKNRALEINEDIVSFLNIKQNPSEQEESKQEEDFQDYDDYEEDELTQKKEEPKKQQFQEPSKKTLIQIPLGETYGDKFKVNLEEFEEPRKRFDSIIPHNSTSYLKIAGDEQPSEIINNDGQQKPLNQTEQNFMIPIQGQPKILNFYNTMASPFAFHTNIFNQFDLQSQINNREYERKTSLNFGSSWNPSQFMGVTSPLLQGLQTYMPNTQQEDLTNQSSFMGPFTLPPRQNSNSTAASQPQQNSSTTPRFNQPNNTAFTPVNQPSGFSYMHSPNFFMAAAPPQNHILPNDQYYPGMQQFFQQGTPLLNQSMINFNHFQQAPSQPPFEERHNNMNNKF